MSMEQPTNLKDFVTNFRKKIKNERQLRLHQINVLQNMIILYYDIALLVYDVDFRLWFDDDCTKFVEFTIIVNLGKGKSLEIEHKAELDSNIDIFEIERRGDFEHPAILGWTAHKDKILEFLKDYKKLS